jgi:outer membrane protein OmpA-like peptidoglycan-associated protein
MARLSLILLLLLALGACGPRTTVVVVPDDDGHVGQVSVTAAKDSRVIGAADESVVVTDVVGKSKTMSPADISKNFGQALAATPAKPLSWQLYFRPEAAEPEAASARLIPEIVDAIRARAIARVTVIGHTDSMGDQQYNDRLSIARAEAVKKHLAKAGVDPSIIKTVGFGPTDPLVPTKPGVPEQKNRRVEVFVR